MGMVHVYSWCHALCLIIAAFSLDVVVGTHAVGASLPHLPLRPALGFEFRIENEGSSAIDMLTQDVSNV
jgi:hypothetical protein